MISVVKPSQWPRKSTWFESSGFFGLISSSYLPPSFRQAECLSGMDFRIYSSIFVGLSSQILLCLQLSPHAVILWGKHSVVTLYRTVVPSILHLSSFWPNITFIHNACHCVIVCLDLFFVLFLLLNFKST